ncbi:hypothetical protein MRX96_025746 [Rhipicephalus microplus]
MQNAARRSHSSGSHSVSYTGTDTGSSNGGGGANGGGIGASLDQGSRSVGRTSASSSIGRGSTLSSLGRNSTSFTRTSLNNLTVSSSLVYKPGGTTPSSGMTVLSTTPSRQLPQPFIVEQPSSGPFLVEVTRRSSASAAVSPLYSGSIAANIPSLAANLSGLVGIAGTSTTGVPTSIPTTSASALRETAMVSAVQSAEKVNI